MSTKNMMTAVGAVGLLVSVAVLPSRAAENRRNVPPQQQPPPPQQRLGRIEKADEVIGSQIKNSQGQTFSKIDQVVVDLESGRVLFAVASVDGNEVAVAPGSFSMGTGARTFTLEGAKQKLAGAPQVNKDQA